MMDEETDVIHFAHGDEDVADYEPDFTEYAHDDDPLMTAYEWSDVFGVTIIDPDGWRRVDASLDDLIDSGVFIERMTVSTVKFDGQPDARPRKWSRTAKAKGIV